MTLRAFTITCHFILGLHMLTCISIQRAFNDALAPYCYQRAHVA